MDLLGRARNFLKGVAAPPVSRTQYYSVVCPLGHRVRGQRTEGYQALRCPACGEGVFVLPASPLPEPVPPARSSARRPVRDRVAVDEGPVQLEDPAEVTVDFEEPRETGREVEIVWDDEPSDVPQNASRPAYDPDLSLPESPTPGPEPTAEVARRSSRAAAKASSPQPRPRPTAAEVPPRPREGTRAEVSRVIRPANEPLVKPEMQPDRPRRGLDRRPILIVAAVALLIVAAFAIRGWRTRRGELPQIARQGKEEGIPALKTGKFERANQILGAAREAVESLGGKVEDAEEILKAADEAAILADLSSDSLESILDEAGRLSPQSWATRFDQVYKGRAVVIDTTIAATPDSGPQGRFEIDYVVVPLGEGAGQERYARFDLSNFELFKDSGHRVGDHVLIGARLGSFAYDKGSNCWMIRFEPRSGVRITYNEALEALGWSRSAELDGIAKEGDRP